MEKVPCPGLDGDPTSELLGEIRRNGVPHLCESNLFRRLVDEDYDPCGNAKGVTASLRQHRGAVPLDGWGLMQFPFVQERFRDFGKKAGRRLINIHTGRPETTAYPWVSQI